MPVNTNRYESSAARYFEANSQINGEIRKNFEIVLRETEHACYTVATDRRPKVLRPLLHTSGSEVIPTGEPEHPAD